MRTRRILATALLLMMVAPVALAAEGEVTRPAGDPSDVVSRTSSQITQIALEAKDQAGMLAEMTKVLDGMLDYEEFSKRTLKGTWDKLSTSDRKRFIGKFQQLIIKVYARRFKPGSKFTIELRGETGWTDEAKLEGKVRTVVKGGSVVADVDYRFLVARGAKDAEWRSWDIVIDGVSMVLNWRAQFKRVIDKDGFEALLAKIDKRVSREE